MGNAYDFTIDTLNFRCAINDKTPYARSTAPFRKEQFDSAPTAGDQSLTGWWTRGQFSFHAGSGLRFYEVLDGEGVLNKFTRSMGVNPRIPGEVALGKEFSTWATATSSGWGPSGTSTGSALVTTNPWTNETKIITGASTGPTVSDVVLTGSTGKGIACAASAANYYVATSAKEIYRFTSPGSVDAYTPDGKIYTHTQYIDKIHVAKDRIWVLDRTGGLYAASLNPTGTLPVALGSSPVVTFSDGSTGNNTGGASVYSSITASGQYVYVTRNNNKVYRVGLASDGSVPTLTAPVVACELPAGEQIYGIRAVLGYLIIITDFGVRVAQETNGGLVYGPQLVNSAYPYAYGNAASNIGVIGDRAYVALLLRDEDIAGFPLRTAVVEINLGAPSQDNPLVFPWVEVFSVGDDNGSPYSGVFDIGDTLVLHDGAKLYRSASSTVAPSGTLVTGYHRMGTLEPKRFYSLTVRGEGVGTIGAEYWNDTTGAWVSLGAAFSAADKVTVYTLPSAPLERMRFRFTLTRANSTDKAGPKLLGYQIKALPAPERQRLLKVPLSLQDNVRLRNGTATGRRGRAWADLQALEGLESSKAIVSFTDHRTGETGSAYIDSVDFQSDTPRGPQSDGFGGIAYLQLRIVS